MELVLSNELIRLRGDAGRYRSLHQRALKRLDNERTRHAEKVRQLKTDYESRIGALSDEIIDLKKQIKTLQDLHFGKSSEKSVSVAGDLSTDKKKRKRPRGQQRGRKGHGRRPHTELPCEDEILDLPEEEARCPGCGELAIKTQLEGSSEEISYEVRVIRKRLRRPYHKRTCSCVGVPRYLSAQLPVRAFPKSKYSDSFWIEVLLFKYEYQFPLERFVRLLSGYGLEKVACGTLCGGIVRALEMLRPLYEAIKGYNQSGRLRHMDETGLKVFVDKQGKSSYVWWLWQSSSSDSCVFFLDRNRSHDVPFDYLKGTPEDGIIVADRYKVYAKLLQKIAYCWAHVRRDFVRVGRGEPGNRVWAIKWLRRIKTLYRLNRKRIDSQGKPEAFFHSQQALKVFLDEMIIERENELASKNWRTTDSRKKVLKSMKSHWDGLTVFLTDPSIPLDNNFAERLFRSVANFRKSCFGVHSEKFGHLTAMALSIFATVKLNKIPLRSFLTDYFEAVAEANGKWERIVHEFLPWDLAPKRKEQLLGKPSVLDSS